MEAWTLTSESILPTGRKTRALLAILALSSPRPMLRSKLAELLWSRRPEEQARASLRQEIHRLLEALHPVGQQIMSVQRDHLTLRPGTVWVDVEEVLRASTSKPQALSLLDGELLEDLDGVDPSFDQWLAGERERLRDRARGLAETLLREKDDPETVIPAAQQLLAIDRTHEGAWRALMRAYTNRGERGMAIQAYERCRAVLADMLDAQPSDETQRLLADIRASSPPAPPAPRPVGNATPAPAPPPTPPRPEPRIPTRDSRYDMIREPRPETRGPERSEARATTTRGGARVGVLPLQMIGTTESENHLSTGLADEITSALARFRWMFLVSSSSLARYATQTRDEMQIRRAFDIHFLLDGTIQRVGERLRINLRLLDLRAGNQVVWSQRFDRAADDLLTLQDDIAAEVVAQIDPEILLIESQRVTSRPSHDANAYDLVLRAMPLISRLDKPLFLEAGDLLRRAVELEPDYAAGHAWYAYWLMFLVGQGWTDAPADAMAEAGRLAERAITLDPQDAKALTIAGHVRAFLHHRLREAIALHERALMLNPNLAMAWNLSGVAFAYLGDLQEAERRVARYKQLSPFDPQAYFYDTARIIIALLKRQHEQAVEIGREVSQMNPAFSAACKPYLAALGHLGAKSEADSVRARLLEIEPEFSISRFTAASPFERAEDRDHYVRGLRLAGIRE
ncbi:MAG: BTAD domain-containing putative transcriptional regulator [Alphaproteobacteria bacterium]|nr:BTAD domain-containing putative transcriptional regulator [Alphaproteobacteria bacterium]